MCTFVFLIKGIKVITNDLMLIVYRSFTNILLMSYTALIRVIAAESLIITSITNAKEFLPF